MRDEITLEAMANAKLEPVTAVGEPFKRYEIQFPDNEIPEEIKRAAMSTEDGKIIGSELVTIPDKNIVPHLKVNKDGTAEITMTVFLMDKGPLYSLDLKLAEAEKSLFDKEIKRIDKETEASKNKE